MTRFPIVLIAVLTALGSATGVALATHGAIRA